MNQVIMRGIQLENNIRLRGNEQKDPCPLCGHPVILLGYEDGYIYYTCAAGAHNNGGCTYKDPIPWDSIQDYRKAIEERERAKWKNVQSVEIK
jgi:hypothetical protein